MASENMAEAEERWFRGIDEPEPDEREPMTPPYTPAEEVVGMLVVGIQGIRDHDLNEMEWAVDLAAKIEALIDTRARALLAATTEEAEHGD